MMTDSQVGEQIRELIGTTALALDAEAYAEFLARCTPDFNYQVTAMSPELGRKMVWLEQSRDEIEKLFAALPEHLTRPGRLTRQASVARINSVEGGFAVTSTVSVFATDFEGRSRILAVGRYEDRVVAGKECLQLQSRELQLDTRDLGIGSHVPL